MIRPLDPNPRGRSPLFPVPFMASVAMLAACSSGPAQVSDPTHGNGSSTAGVQGPTGAPAKTSYAGPECDEVLLRKGSPEAARPSHRRDMQVATPRQEVLFAVCERDKSDKEKVQIASALAQYIAFDDRLADPVTAALVVTKTASASPASSTAKLGAAHLLGGMVEPAALTAKLEKLSVPQGAASAFVGLFEAARASVTQEMAGLSGGKKKVYVDIPSEVHQQRKAYYEAHKAAYQKLDDVLAQVEKDPAKAASSLVALRGEHMTACGTASCAFEPIHREITAALFLIRLQQDDSLAANAEARWLDQAEVVDSTLAGAVFQKQVPDAEAMTEAFKTSKRTQSAGLDPKAQSAALHGVDPVNFGAGALLWPGPADNLKKAWALRADEETRLFQAGVVSATKKNGARTTLEFLAEPPREDEGQCVSITRLTGIGDGGVLLWDRGCPLLPRLPLPMKLQPVSVDEAEAAKIEVGEVVTMVVDAKSKDRSAVVFQARKGKNVVQIRGDRVKPAP